MPEGEGTYGNKRGRPPEDPRKKYIPTKDLAVKLKELNKAPENTLNKNRQLNFILKKDKRGKWYKHYEDGTRGNIKHSVGEQIAKDKAQGKPNTSHYTVEHVRMKDVKDPEKVPKKEEREKIVAENQKKSIKLKTDANTKKPVSTKFKGKGKAGIALGLASLLGLSMSADKSKKKEKVPKRKTRGLNKPKQQVPTKDNNNRVDSAEEIKKRMKKDKDSSPVDFKGDYPVYRKGSAPAQDFRSTYNQAKKAGKKVFTWQGRKYNTK